MFNTVVHFSCLGDQAPCLPDAVDSFLRRRFSHTLLCTSHVQLFQGLFGEEIRNGTWNLRFQVPFLVVWWGWKEMELENWGFQVPPSTYGTWFYSFLGGMKLIPWGFYINYKKNLIIQAKGSWFISSSPLSQLFSSSSSSPQDTNPSRRLVPAGHSLVPAGRSLVPMSRFCTATLLLLDFLRFSLF